MEAVLSARSREVLRQFAWSNVLLAFDYDGTLAPIVADPAKAAMRPRTRALFTEVARRYPCIVISGRARADVLRRLDGVPIDGVIGNHGLEPWAAGARHQREVRRWLPILRRKLAAYSGVELEDKHFSVAIHHRRSRQKKVARQAIARAVASLGAVRVIGGKQVLNVLPEGAPHKGMALERERKRLGCDTAIYVGDDETDEDVFGLDPPGRLLAVRVGPSQTSAATHSLRSQREIDRLLAVLLELRPPREEPSRARR